MPEPHRLPLIVRRLTDGWVILVFAAALGVVLYGTLVREQPPLDENRERHSPPPFALDRQVLQDYPKWFDLYLADRVGYRDVLLRWHQTTVYDGFGEQAAGSKAWVGRDGWLFLNVADPDEYHDDRPTLDERLDTWADEFATRAEYLKARGIGYVVLLPPEKSSVYPEYLPRRYQRHPPPAAGAAMTERLMARGVRVVDPLNAMLAAKDATEQPLFYRRDTHWTGVGARVAYAELARELRNLIPSWSPLPDDEYSLVTVPFEGDLVRFARTTRSGAPESILVHTPTGRQASVDRTPAFADALPPESRNPLLPPVVYTCDTAAGPPVALFRDSFGEHLVPFVSSDFRRVAVVLSDTLEPAVLDEIHPAVVIQEMVSRKTYLIDPPARRFNTRNRD